MSWLITGTQKTDPDALAYLAEVERADGQALESGVRDAVIAFVTGCKADGIWSAVKASCILAGARTLTGALVPLVGTAPTSFNFVDGDYNRKTGLVGDGSTKYLDSNRNDNADPQDSIHNSVFVSTAQTTTLAQYIGTALVAGGMNLGANPSIPDFFFRNRSNAAVIVAASPPIGFIGHSRNNSANFAYRYTSTNFMGSIASQTPANQNVNLYRRGTNNYANARIAFYSIGESLDLALLDARVTTLIQAIDAAI
jgi:hypothetical protein